MVALRLFWSTSNSAVIIYLLIMCRFSKSANTVNMNIDSLGHDLRNFVIKYEQGSRQASQLVSSEALQMRETVVRQSGKTEKALRAHVTRTSAKLERKFGSQIEWGRRQQRQDRLLQSLKYPGMRERANQVENAHAGTFGWLFADVDDSSCSGDEESCSDSSERLGDQDSRSEDDWSDIDTDDEYEEESPEMVWSSFTDWLQSDLSIYWIMGKPGSGKSTLAKFILSDPRTKIALDKWRRGAIISSHFFWRPGSLLQRSIKGMFCSVIHQLIHSVPDGLQYVSANVAEINQKDEHTDWSVTELQQLCLGLIRHCGKPLCLFIDGLDECGPEDHHQKLLDTIERIRLPNVKIIASSRNEPIFEKRFRHEPQLRVQDLTAGDMHTYATEMLTHEIPATFRAELVEKAEGVFLWLVLAVQSINRGFVNGETLKDLRGRFRSLPKGLNDLYKDMWERLNDDSHLYRESAAVYFKLAIAPIGEKLKCLADGWTTLEMMLASLTKDHYPLAKRPIISVSQLVDECVGFENRVQVYCAGLLSLYREPGDHPLKDDLGDSEISLLEYGHKRAEFRFIHRSAHDFLVDTVEGQNILKYDGMSPEDTNIRILNASLRAAELLRLMLPKATSKSEARLHYPPRDLGTYLHDLSRIADGRHNGVGDLISLCYQLYNSSHLISKHRDERPIRAADFFGDAANYPRLNCYYTSIIEKQLVGSNVRSAILLSVTRKLRRCFPFELAGWLLSLPDMNVNLKCPLLVLRDEQAYYTLGGMSPLDHIKASPFTRLLGSGLEQINWRFSESNDLYSTRRQLNSATQFLRLVSDFLFHGADIHSTLLIAFHPDYTYSSTQFGTHGVLQIPGWDLSLWDEVQRHNDKILCVVALQPTSVIQRILARLPKTEPGHENTDKDQEINKEDECSVANLDKAVSFLSQRCQESDCRVKDHVIGFLQRCDGSVDMPYRRVSDDSVDMPYRRVSDQDSENLMEMIWACIFEGGSRHLGTRCREVIARSPFSSIGFRDYLRDMGCFDELAAHKLLLEYQQGKVTSPTTCTVEFRRY